MSSSQDVSSDGLSIVTTQQQDANQHAPSLRLDCTLDSSFVGCPCCLALYTKVCSNGGSRGKESMARFAECRTPIDVGAPAQYFQLTVFIAETSISFRQTEEKSNPSPLASRHPHATDDIAQ